MDRSSSETKMCQYALSHNVPSDAEYSKPNIYLTHEAWNMESRIMDS